MRTSLWAGGLLYTCIIFFCAVVKHFALLECTFLVRFVSVNNPILFIYVESNLPQIINVEKPLDLFNVVYGYTWVKIALPAMTSLGSSKSQNVNRSTWFHLSNIDGLVNSVYIYLFYKLLLEKQIKTYLSHQTLLFTIKQHLSICKITGILYLPIGCNGTKDLGL